MHTHPDTERVPYDREALSLSVGIDEESLQAELGNTIRIIRIHEGAGAPAAEVDLGCWGTESVLISEVFPQADMKHVLTALNAYRAVRDRDTQSCSYSVGIQLAAAYLSDIFEDYEIEIFRKRPNLYLADVGYALCWWLIEHMLQPQE